MQMDSNVNKVKLVCAYNIVKGGGVKIVIDFCKFCLDNNINIILLYPGNKTYSKEVKRLKMEFPSFKTIIFPVKWNKVYFKIFINYIFLPRFVTKYNIAKIYNFGNVAFPSKVKQFLLVQNAFAGLDISHEAYKYMKFKDRFIQILMSNFITYNLRFADVIGVQTNAMANVIGNYLKKNQKLILAPNLPQFVKKSYFFNCRRESGINLLFLSKYYSHKNFEILIDLAKQIDYNRLDIQISITFDMDIKAEREFLTNIRKYIDLGIIKNIGYIPSENIEKTYLDHCGLFLPSLLESYSGTYLEAVKFGTPIFTSDREFAKEILGDNAYFFDPTDVSDILETIIRAFSDRGLMKTKVKKLQDHFFNINDDQTVVFKRILESI